MQQFEDLRVWQAAITLAKDVYCLLGHDMLKTEWSLKDQMKRSSVSISSNIAEGYERKSNKEYIRFLYIAKGSCGELRSQLHLLHELYEIEIDKIHQKCIILSRQIQSLINTIQP